jgi:hypothetical protein
MSKSTTYAFLATFVLGAGLGTAHAQQQPSSQPYGQQSQQPSYGQPSSQHGQPSSQQGGSYGQPGREQAGQPQVLGSSYTAQVTGEVVSVDQASGRLTLRTVDGQLTAMFPPVAVQNVKPGDQVTVAIGLIETNPPSASPRTGPGSMDPGSTGSGSMGSGSTGSGSGSMGSGSTGTQQPGGSTR